MKPHAIALQLGLAMAGGASAEPAHYHAGVTRLGVADLVPGSHFVFIDPCPPDLAAKVPAICQDAPDVDRAAIHRRLEGEISDFLQQNL
jgi:hypothetical protein